MWGILHIPTGSYLYNSSSEKSIYKNATKNGATKTLMSCFDDYGFSRHITIFIPGNTRQYPAILSEFEVVELPLTEEETQ